MTFFEEFTSNTYAGSGNQHVFLANKDEVHTGRVFYKISHAGQYRYSLLFSNILDSTFADGSVSHRNLICDSWHILGAKIGKCGKEAIPDTFTEPAHADAINRQVCGFQPLTFDGRPTKTVAPGEFFCSDPVPFSFDAGDYLCLEMTFSGRMIPYHEETLLPVFKKQGETWVYAKEMPFAGMVGCNRAVKARIGYLGDSITQGIGTALNSYAHWNALLSEKLGAECAYWNLGLGYGRANDIASDGAWLYKAKQNDILVVCCGVNDICQGLSEEQIIRDLNTIVELLQKAGKTVILQTVPPFDYSEDDVPKWKRINQHILHTLSEKVALVFDVVPHLQESNERAHIARFGGHPDENGCAVWAKALYEEMTKAHIPG